MKFFKIRKGHKKRRIILANWNFKKFGNPSKILEIPQKYLSTKKWIRPKIRRKPLKNWVLRNFQKYQRNRENNSKMLT